MSFSRRYSWRRSASCAAIALVVVSLPSSERNLTPGASGNRTHPVSNDASGNRSTAGNWNGHTIADFGTSIFDFSTIALKKPGLTTIDTTLGTIGSLKQGNKVSGNFATVG